MADPASSASAEVDASERSRGPRGWACADVRARLHASCRARLEARRTVGLGSPRVVGYGVWHCGTSSQSHRNHHWGCPEGFVQGGKSPAAPWITLKSEVGRGQHQAIGETTLTMADISPTNRRSTTSSEASTRRISNCGNRFMSGSCNASWTSGIAFEPCYATMRQKATCWKMSMR